MVNDNSLEHFEENQFVSEISELKKKQKNAINAVKGLPIILVIDIIWLLDSFSILKLIFVILFVILIIYNLISYFILDLKLANYKKENPESFNKTYMSSLANTSDNLSELELRCKEYILQYKSQYSKESIKEGLKNMGISEMDSDNYLDKYF